MAGSKRNKVKKIFSPPPSNPPPENNLTNDDDDLMNDLLTELDSRDQTVQAESATILNEMQINKAAGQVEKSQPESAGRDAKARFLARQARKAAALTQNYPATDADNDARIAKEAKEEEQSIKRTCEQLSVQIHEINPDGHCLFSAIADQLALLNILPANQATYATVRHAASSYMYAHPDDFLPFLPSASGEDGAGATDNTGLMSPQEFERYCITIRDTGIWGGEPEILALSKAFNIPIHVVQGGTPPIVMHNPNGDSGMGAVDGSHVVRISYHRRMYGLGEHYNSLRPKSGFTNVADKIHAILS